MDQYGFQISRRRRQESISLVHRSYCTDVVRIRLRRGAGVRLEEQERENSAAFCLSGAIWGSTSEKDICEVICTVQHRADKNPTDNEGYTRAQSIPFGAVGMV